MFKKTLLACVMGSQLTSQVMAQTMDLAAVDFDQDTLKSLGVNPGISNYFSRKARYLPGSTTVSLKLNGADKGSVIARFNDEGELCFDKSFMNQAGLKIPSDYSEGCYDYLKTYPSTVVDTSPAQEQLSLVVPQDAVMGQDNDYSGYDSGGTAGLLNYSLMSMRSEFSGGNSDYSQAILDGGINFNDWLLRSHQILSRTDGEFNSENSSTYLQHTFVGMKTTGRVGEVGINNTLLEGTEIYGVELSPESALRFVGSDIQVSGIANTSQARVEVRQQGVLVYSTLVPAGPFTLTDIPLRNTTSDLNVTVVESDGNQHSFIIPASLYNQKIGSPGGVYFSAGRVSDNYDRTPWVMSASAGWQLSSRINANAGALVAEEYQAAAVSLDTLLLPGLLISTQTNQSNDTHNSLQGQKYVLSGTYSMSGGFGLNSSVSYNSRNYREFSDSLDNDFDDNDKSTYSIGINWSQYLIGGLNASYYETQGYEAENDARYMSLSWNKTFRHATVSVNWQHQLSAGEDNEDDGDMFYINLSIPFGAQSVNIYSHQDDSKTRYGASAMGVINDETTYNLGVEHDQSESDDSVNAGINTNLHYTQLGLNVSAGSENQRNYSGTLQGGIAAHSSGVTLSPWAIRDTFAIASLDKKVAGIKLDTPQGPVWTDAWGKAVIPSVSAWRSSRVEINTETLPKNMDVGNGTRIVKQGRGSVGQLQFSAITQRRALLTVTMQDGKKLPKGIAITDEHGNYLTTSVDDGVIFVNDVKPKQTLVAVLDNGECRIALSIPEEARSDVFYETTKGVCQ